MKSFFEFYEKLKAKKLNENMGMPQQNGMGGAPMGGMSGPPMGSSPMGGMGGMGGSSMGSPSDASMGMGGGDMNMDLGMEESPEAGMDKTSQKNTAGPEGDSMRPEEIYGMLDQIANFIKNASGKDGQEEVDPNLKSEMESTLDSLKSNLETLTGVSAPSSSDETEESMGGEQPDEKGVGINDASPQEMDSGGAPSGSPAGGSLFPSNAGGSGDMGMGGMGGGSSPMGGGGGSGGGMFGM